MAQLRLHPESYARLEHWWFGLETFQLDRHLVNEMLTQLEFGGLSACRFYYEGDIVDPSRTNVFPRGGLVVVVQMFADEPDQFAIVTIQTLDRHPDA